MGKQNLYRGLRQIISSFFFVLFHWREYHEVVLTILQPWYDVVDGVIPQYMSDPDNWRCKFCGRPYHDSWINSQKQHHDGCLWLRIEKIHPHYR